MSSSDCIDFALVRSDVGRLDVEIVSEAALIVVRSDVGRLDVKEPSEPPPKRVRSDVGRLDEGLHRHPKRRVVRSDVGRLDGRNAMGIRARVVRSDVGRLDVQAFDIGGDQLVAHKTRVHLNNKQSSWMKDNCIACRLAYNFAVGKLRDSKKEDGTPFPSAFTVSKQWTQERDMLHPWMRERGLNLDTISTVFSTRYAAALNNWKKAGWSGDKAPVFQGRGRGLSSQWRGRLIKQVGPKTFNLPGKHGTFRLGEPIRFDGEIRSVTFSYEGDKWYASFLIKTKLPKPEHAPEGTAIGVDLGVANFATLSDGTKVPPSMNHQSELDKLAKLQRESARMQGPVKGKQRASRNWVKHQTKIQRQHRRIANKRRHYAECLTKTLASDYQTIAIEDLKVKNMTASAKGTQDEPGKNVKAKSGLNRSVLNGGFAMFRTRLEAKASARGGQVIAVNAAYTSQTCVVCGHVAKENRKTQAAFECVSCGHQEHADVNAAQNILHRALSGAGIIQA